MKKRKNMVNTLNNIEIKNIGGGLLCYCSNYDSEDTKQYYVQLKIQTDQLAKIGGFYFLDEVVKIAKEHPVSLVIVSVKQECINICRKAQAKSYYVTLSAQNYVLEYIDL